MAAAAVARLAAAEACRACQTAAAAAVAAVLAPVEAALLQAIAAVEAASVGGCGGWRRRRPRRPLGGARRSGSWEAVAATTSEGSILSEVSPEKVQDTGASPAAGARCAAAPTSSGGGSGAGTPPVAGHVGRADRTPSRSGAGKVSGNLLPPVRPFLALLERWGAAEGKGTTEGKGVAGEAEADTLEKVTGYEEAALTKTKVLGGCISELAEEVDQAADRLAKLAEDDREMMTGLDASQVHVPVMSPPFLPKDPFPD